MPQQECQFKLKVQMWHIYLLRKHRCLPQNLLTSPGEKTWAFTRCYYAVWGQNCRISCVITQEIWQCCPRTVTSTMGGGRRFLSRRQYLFFFCNTFCGALSGWRSPQKHLERNLTQLVCNYTRVTGVFFLGGNIFCGGLSGWRSPQKIWTSVKKMPRFTG